jgi:hypothetical protein
MGYKMKNSIPGLLGINEKHSTPDTPVFEKDLGQSWGHAEMDRTITVNKNLNEKQKKDAVEHEKQHILQMRSGRSWYDNNNIYHKPKKDEPIQVYKRVGNKMIVKGHAMDVGDPSNPVEKEVYSITKKFATKIKK